MIAIPAKSILLLLFQSALLSCLVFLSVKHYTLGQLSAVAAFINSA